MTLPDKTDAELREVRVLNRTSVLEVIALQVELYGLTYQSRPQVIFLNSKLRTAFTVELITQLKMPADAAIAEPLWMDGVPILYSKGLGDEFIVLSNRRTQEEISL